MWNPLRALMSGRTARFVVLNSFCEDWRVVNWVEYLKIAFLASEHIFGVDTPSKSLEFEPT